MRPSSTHRARSCFATGARPKCHLEMSGPASGVRRFWSASGPVLSGRWSRIEQKNGLAFPVLACPGRSWNIKASSDNSWRCEFAGSDSDHVVCVSRPGCEPAHHAIVTAPAARPLPALPAFVGFLWDLLLEPTSARVSLVDESTFYLQLRVVGGAGFEPATPAL